jgi:hypothetical protein
MSLVARRSQRRGRTPPPGWRGRSSGGHCGDEVTVTVEWHQGQLRGRTVASRMIPCDLNDSMEFEPIYSKWFSLRLVMNGDVRDKIPAGD